MPRIGSMADSCASWMHDYSKALGAASSVPHAPTNPIACMFMKAVHQHPASATTKAPRSTSIAQRRKLPCLRSPLWWAVLKEKHRQLLSTDLELRTTTTTSWDLKLDSSYANLHTRCKVSLSFEFVTSYDSVYHYDPCREMRRINMLSKWAQTGATTAVLLIIGYLS